MGNCQANDAAVAVIQHPDGGVERLDWPMSAEEVMRNHPGHYVALVTLCINKDGQRAATSTAAVHFTRVRLLKHKDKLLIGHVYRLITYREVTEALKERKHERIRKAQAELVKQQQSTSVEDGLNSEVTEALKEMKHERIRKAQAELVKQQQSTSVEDGLNSGEENAKLDCQKMYQAEKYERQRQRSTRNWQPSLQSISETGI